MSAFNNLVVNVIQARSLRLKHTPPQAIYVSLTTAGSGKWKSKVCTNSVETADGHCEWREHCEFDLNELDTELHLHVNHKNKLGLTETLGEVVFQLEQMAKYQAPTWYRLTKGHDEARAKDRGLVQLEFQLANKLSSSVSSASINKVEKDSPLDKFKRKVSALGAGLHNKKASTTLANSNSDSTSFASLSIGGRHSPSGSSMNSALAFSTPSPNPHHLSPADLHVSMDTERSVDAAPPDTHQPTKRPVEIRVEEPSPANSARAQAKLSVKPTPRPREVKVGRSDHKKDQRSVGSATVGHNSPSRNSLASSGIASANSGSLEALSESTSPAHLLNVIRHLRGELISKEQRIRDLEEYTDRLLSKVIDRQPELLLVSSGGPSTPSESHMGGSSTSRRHFAGGSSGRR